MSVTDPQPTEQAARRGGGEGRGWRFYMFVSLAVLALIFVLQNTEETRVDFLFANAELPLFFALLIAILLGVAIGWLIPKVRGADRRED